MCTDGEENTPEPVLNFHSMSPVLASNGIEVAGGVAACADKREIAGGDDRPGLSVAVVLLTPLQFSSRRIVGREGALGVAAGTGGRINRRY
jgi:hypothetical protein